MQETSRVAEWVHLCERWCEPDWVHWCDGPSDAVTRIPVPADGTAAPPARLPAGGCVSSSEAIARIALECQGALRGRTLYVVPHLLAGDEAGVLVTDCAALAASFCRTVPVGANALTSMATGREFAATLFLQGNGSGEERFIRCHMEGPPSDDTACRTAGRERIKLPLQQTSFVSGSASCLECERLCPNRARAIVEDAIGQRHDTPRADRR
jgi:GTP-dependent phosphoenolpyruvate carboxykinase